MGEARRKRLARESANAWGLPTPRPDTCPECGSKRIVHVTEADYPDLMRTARLGGHLGVCQDCPAIWEAFPPTYVEDPVCAEPCDNCAFRPGSPEQQDTDEWRALINKLQPDESYGHFTGQFFCHKGVPIDRKIGPGNFLFPLKPVMVDGEPVRNADGTIATVADTAKMRTCSGFLRMVWALNDKREKTEESHDLHRPDPIG